jgi:putative sterol carrier protein
MGIQLNLGKVPVIEYNYLIIAIIDFRGIIMGTLENGTMEEIWQDIDFNLTNKKEPYSGMKGTYEIQITDEDITYQLSFQDGNFTLEKNGSGNPDCTLKMKNSVFRKFLAGNLNSMTAFMTGKLKVDGNITLALKLESLLKQYQF